MNTELPNLRQLLEQRIYELETVLREGKHPRWSESLIRSILNLNLDLYTKLYTKGNTNANRSN